MTMKASSAVRADYYEWTVRGISIVARHGGDDRTEPLRRTHAGRGLGAGSDCEHDERQHFAGREATELRGTDRLDRRRDLHGDQPLVVDRRQALQLPVRMRIGWEIKGGKLGRMVRNPSYSGITTEFWNSMDAICDPREWTLWGTPNCGKGQPEQGMGTGHGAAPARFRQVKVGGAYGSKSRLQGFRVSRFQD